MRESEPGSHEELEHDFWIEESDMIGLGVGGNEYALICPHCAPSYFTYKPEILKSEICINAKSELCFGCREPECELSDRCSEVNPEWKDGTMKLWAKTGILGAILSLVGMYLEYIRPWNIGKTYIYNNFYIAPIIFGLCILCFSMGLHVGGSQDSTETPT